MNTPTNELSALDRVLRYLRGRQEQPMPQLGDCIHSIHGGEAGGLPDGADLLLSDVQALALAAKARRERRFPILGEPREAAIPWDMIEPHNGQAMRNHGGQNLHALAGRGGLDWSEAVAVMLDEPFKPRDPHMARGMIESMVQAWRKAAQL